MGVILATYKSWEPILQVDQGPPSDPVIGKEQPTKSADAMFLLVVFIDPPCMMGLMLGRVRTRFQIDFEGFHMFLAVSAGQLYCAGHRWQDTTTVGSRCALRKRRGGMTRPYLEDHPG